MKVVSLILTFALMVSMVVVPSVTTNAGGAAGDYSITIKPNASSPDIANRNFVAIKVLEATVSGDHAPYSVGYSICPEITGYKEVLLNALKAVNPSYAGSLSGGSSDAEVLDAIRELEENETDDYTMEKFAEELLKEIEQKVATESGTGSFTTAFKVATKAGGAVDAEQSGNHIYAGAADSLNYKFSNLTGGYYLIKDLTQATADDVVAALTLTTTTPNKEVIAKVTKPSVDKVITDASYNTAKDAVGTANVGDTVHFRIDANIPDVRGYDKYTYSIVDTLDTGLKYTAKTLQVEIVDPSGDEETHKDYLLERGDAAATANARATITVPLASAESGGQISIALLLDQLKALEQYQGMKFIITYDATITSKAAIGFEDPTSNNVDLNYNNNPVVESDGVKQEDRTDTYLFNLELDKIDSGAENAPLKGASFRIYQMVGGVKKYAKFTTDERAEGADPSDVSDVVKRVVASWGETPGNKNDGFFTFTTKKDTGNVIIQGLSADCDYYLEEVIAPDGHKLMTKDIQISIDGSWDNLSSGKTKLNSATLTEVADDGNHLDLEHVGTVDTVKPAQDMDAEVNTFKIFIKNDKGAALPETGGMGTTLIYTLGGALVVIAGVLLISKKRMSATR